MMGAPQNNRSLAETSVFSPEYEPPEFDRK